MFNKPKTYNFSEQELEGLKQMDTYIALRNAEINMGKNMYGNIVDSAIKRCGYDPKKLMDEKKRLNIDLAKGIFSISEPVKAEPQNKPPSKDSTAAV